MNNYFVKIYSRVTYKIFILLHNLLPTFVDNLTSGIVWGIVGFPCPILVPYIETNLSEKQRQSSQFHSFNAHMLFIALGIELATDVTTNWLFKHRHELILFTISFGCSLLLAEYKMSDIPLMFALGGAALISSIAGFAFSAIAGAILFHLSSDTIRVLELMICCSRKISG
jgi:multidrug transporter EmrE-like cation transporter